MKKKMLILCLAIMLVLPTALFAGSFLGLKVGPAAILNAPINLETVDPDYFTELGVEDFALGVDARFNVSLLQIAALIQGQYFPGEEILFFDGHIGAGLSLDLMGLVGLGFAVGPEISGVAGEFGAEVGFWDEFGYFQQFTEENIDMLPLIIRGMVDVNLGGISVSAFAKINSGVTVGDVAAGDFPNPEEIDTTAIVGLSVLLGLL